MVEQNSSLKYSINFINFFICVTLVSALASVQLDYSKVGRIVEDCKDYMSFIPSLNFRYNYREINGVAHRLAHLASLTYLDHDYWVGELPSIIEDALFEDFCKYSRGSSILSPSMYTSVISN